MKTIQLTFILSCIVSYCFGQDPVILQVKEYSKIDTVYLKGSPSTLKIGEILISYSGMPIYMIYVEGSAFTMSKYKQENDAVRYKTILNDFYICDSEVTYNEFEYFLNDYGSDKIKAGEYKGKKLIHKHDLLKKKEGWWNVKEGYKDYPVTHVTWYGAQEYCHWLSEKTGQNYYLPTEAQWEYAARGGKYGIEDNFTFSGSNRLDSIAWFSQNSQRRLISRPVRRRLSNQLGLYDMSGNVWEWCADVKTENTIPKESSPSNIKIFRGGSWINNPEYCSVTYRSKSGPSFASSSLGFRIARDVNANSN